MWLRGYLYVLMSFGYESYLFFYDCLKMLVYYGYFIRFEVDVKSYFYYFDYYDLVDCWCILVVRIELFLKFYVFEEF